MLPLISVSHLSKSFPGVRAPHDCQFELLAGEVHALTGENGAGKFPFSPGEKAKYHDFNFHGTLCDGSGTHRHHPGPGSPERVRGVHVA